MNRLDAQRVADRVDRVDLRRDIIVPYDVGQARIGRFPRYDEDAESLRDRPGDEAFLGIEIEDVETVDPRRKDDQRHLKHLVGRRGILDQLVEPRLVDHLARRHGDIMADFECCAVGMG